MPNDPESRRALLERIIAAGDRRRRRWLIGPGVLVAVSVLTVVVLSDGGGDRLSVTADQTTSTTESSSPAPLASDESTTTTESTASSTTVDEGTSTTEAPPVCRNSHDPRCGPFYWDYDPATFRNAPLELSVTSAPERPVAGQPVTFSVRFHDPDQSGADNCATAEFPGSTSAGDPDEGDYSEPNGDYRWSCLTPMCARPYPERYGPWDPPPPQKSEPQTRRVSRIYEQPGDYTVTIDATSGLAGCGFEGYRSRATLTVPVHVDP